MPFLRESRSPCTCHFCVNRAHHAHAIAHGRESWHSSRAPTPSTPPRARAQDREATDGWPLEPSTRVQLAIGRAVTAVEVIAANRLRSWGMAHVAALIRDQQLDAIATPTASRTAPPLSAAAALSGESDTALIVGLIKHIFLGNLLGLPAITVPIGLGNDTRLPVGMQFLGGWWEEARLLRLACALEREMPELPRPPTFFDELDELLGGGGRGGARA